MCLTILNLNAIAFTAFTLLHAAESTNPEIQASSAKVKREIGDSAILPISNIGGYWGVEFTNKGDTSVLGETLKMLIASTCPRTFYFRSSPPDPNNPRIQVDFGIFASNQQSEVEFSGRLAPTRRPSYFSDDKFGVFCLRSHNYPRDPFNNLMELYPDKVISLWFGNVEPNILRPNNRHRVNGELSVGSINQRRIGDGPQVTFQLKPLQMQPQVRPRGWVTLNPVEILVGDEAITQGSCDLVFIYEDSKFTVPSSVYHMITERLKNVERQALDASLPNLPQDLVPGIYDYAATERLRRFDCDDAHLIPDLLLGGLRIPARMLYKIRGDDCKLYVRPKSSGQIDQCELRLGARILANFHVAMRYTVGQESIKFSPRAS